MSKSSWRSLASLHRLGWFLFLVVLVFGGGFMGGVRADPRVRAPSFPPSLEWFNVARPLSSDDLRGRVVVLDFWTYCCINCLHVIPDLQKLEARFGDKLLVIGVHSGKFSNEKADDNIRRAIVRYGIEHPVVNDKDYAVWSAFAVRGWPTFVVIDPAGYVVAQTSGEGNYSYLEGVIEPLAAKISGASLPALPRALERERTTSGYLAYPAKVLADEAHGRLFIADTEHHRIVIANLEGKVLETIGSGEPGGADGDYQTASFLRPHGLALKGERLFVADTGNHRVRVIDLGARRVAGLLGTGSQGIDRRVGGSPVGQPLNSPWDLAVEGEKLYIAMAGSHQIWVYDEGKNSLEVFAGSGVEALVDGGSGAAAFAQPSGLAVDGGALVVADSETSAIRSIALQERLTKTLVGRGLFDFGDSVGPLGAALFQHPLGVAAGRGVIYVADSYNHRIKVIDLSRGVVSSLAGSGAPGSVDGVGAGASFSEPGGISLGRESLYVADTNNSLIRVVALSNGAVRTVPVAPPAPAAPRPAGGFLPNLTELVRPVAAVRSLSEMTIEVKLGLPRRHEVNKEAPGRVSVRAASSGDVLIGEAPLDADSAAIPIHWSEGPPTDSNVELVVEAVVYFCEESKKAVCKIQSFRFFQPVRVDPLAAASVVEVEGEVKE